MEKKNKDDKRGPSWDLASICRQTRGNTSAHLTIHEYAAYVKMSKIIQYLHQSVDTLYF